MFRKLFFLSIISWLVCLCPTFSYAQHKNLTGYYHTPVSKDNPATCVLSVKITKIKNQYFYAFNIAGTIKKGKLELTEGDDANEVDLVFSGIKWASYRGDLENEKKGKQKALKVPVGIEGVWTPDGITIQNYGNAMNSYVQIDACGDKYITLVK